MFYQFIEWHNKSKLFQKLINMMNVGEVRIAEDSDFALLKVRIIFMRDFRQILDFMIFSRFC